MRLLAFPDFPMRLSAFSLEWITRYCLLFSPLFDEGMSSSPTNCPQIKKGKREVNDR